MKTQFSIITFYDPFGDMKSTRKQLSRKNYESEMNLEQIDKVINAYNDGKYYNAVKIAPFDGRLKSEIKNFDKSFYLTEKALPATYQHI